MSRTARAIGAADMDVYARSVGLKSAQEYADHLRLHRRLNTGGRITPADIERVRERDPHIPLEALNRLADWVNEGATGRDRADRYCDAVAHGIEQASGVPVDRHAMREQARGQGEQFEVREYTDPLTRRLEDREAHRDRQNGIDEASRVERAKRASAANPDAIRRADLAEAVARHEGPTPKFYSQDRREILAQASDRIGERMVRRLVRDADPERLPDRSDDRRADIALEIDRHTVEEAGRDELTLAANPLLEGIDNALSDSESER